MKSWDSARLMCNKLGAELAMPKSKEELNQLQEAMKLSTKSFCAYVGLFNMYVASSTANMYRYMYTYINYCFYEKKVLITYAVDT